MNVDFYVLFERLIISNAKSKRTMFHPESVKSSNNEAPELLSQLSEAQEPAPDVLNVWPAARLRFSVAGGIVLATRRGHGVWYKVKGVKGVKTVPDENRGNSIEFHIELEMSPPFDEVGAQTWVPICDVNQSVIDQAQERGLAVEKDPSGANIVAYGREGAYYEVEKVLAFKYNKACVKWRNIDRPEWIHRAYLDEACNRDVAFLVRQKNHQRSIEKSERAIKHAYAKVRKAHFAHWKLTHHMHGN